MTRRNLVLGLAAAGWLVAVGAGGAAAIDYETSPGARAEAPLRWPAGSVLPAPAHRPHVVMFVHPRCPCSRASLGELGELVAGAGGAATFVVVVTRPVGADAEWLATETVLAARALPGVTVIVDDAGVEAARFGARTSGQVVAYGTDGTLGYAGGVTRARGHQGTSVGRRAVAALIARGKAELARHDVFGCALGDAP
jgi:hypothetical protein